MSEPVFLPGSHPPAPATKPSSQSLAALEQAKARGAAAAIRKVIDLLRTEAAGESNSAGRRRRVARAAATTMEEAQAADLAGEAYDHAADVLRRVADDLTRQLPTRSRPRAGTRGTKA